MATKEELAILDSINHRRISYPRIFVDYMGDHDGAIFLNQLWFWSSRGKRSDGFIYKNRAEWQAETGLTDYAIRKATDFLKAEKILETELHRVNGAPTLHFRLNTSLLLDRLKDLAVHQAEADPGQDDEELQQIDPLVSTSDPLVSTEHRLVENTECLTDPNSDLTESKSLCDFVAAQHEPSQAKQTQEKPEPETPTNLETWLAAVEASKNRQAVLVRMFQTLFPTRDSPSYSYVGTVARDVGGAGRLAQLIWRAAAERPTGDVLSYCKAIHKPKESKQYGSKRNGNGNATRSQHTSNGGVYDPNRPYSACNYPAMDGHPITQDEWASYPTCGEYDAAGLEPEQYHLYPTRDSLAALAASRVSSV